MTKYLASQIPWGKIGLAGLVCTIVLTPGHLATPDAHLRLAQARNLVTHGTLAVPEGVGDPTHGNLAPGPNGAMHSVYNPGHAILLAPVYGIASALPRPFGLHPHYVAAFGASFLGILAHFLSALLVLALLLRLGRPPQRSLLLATFFAFGTASLASAADGYDHVFESLAIVLSLYALVDDDGDKEEVRPFIAGLALGAGVMFRYTALLALPGLLWIARDRKARSQVLLGLVPALLVASGYNFFRFGSFFETGYPVAWELAHGNTIGEVGFELSTIPGNLAGLIASPGKGLLWFSPLVALAIPAWAPFRRARPRMADGVMLTSFFYLLFYAANFAWHGSVWSWGPRYVEPIVAPLVLSIAFFPRNRIWRRVLLAVGAVSLTVQASAMMADHRRHLLEEYTAQPFGFEQRLLFEPSSSPLLGQIGSAAHVVRSTIAAKKYEPFIASGPWQSVARPASNQMMLERSIDLNVVDLWWVRLVFFPAGCLTVLVGIFVGGLGSGVFIWLTRSIWRATPEA